MIRARTKPENVFIEELARINPNVVVTENYKNTNTPIACKCKICGYEWAPRPSSLLRGAGCPSCAGNARKSDKEVTK